MSYVEPDRIASVSIKFRHEREPCVRPADRFELSLNTVRTVELNQFATCSADIIYFTIQNSMQTIGGITDKLHTYLIICTYGTKLYENSANSEDR